MIAGSPRHILLIRPSALGDVCRTVPLVVSLKRAYPEAAIDWLVQDSFVEAVRAHPDLREAVPFPRKELGRFMKSGRIDRVLGWMNSVRRRDYDLVVDAQGLLRSGLIAWGTGSPRRVGFANAQEGAALFYNERHRIDRGIHTVDRMLGLLGAAGIEPVRDMRLSTTESDRVEAVGLCAEPGVVIAPTSRWPAKRWPIERFAEVVARLVEAGEPAVTIVGGPGEEPQCGPLLERFAGDARVTNLVGRTCVGVLMAVIERSTLVVANDSAALHMAVGFDRPTVALFGPTEVARVGPYQREAEVIQHLEAGDTLDHKRDEQVRLMERIGVEEVAAAALSALRCPRARSSAP